MTERGRGAMLKGAVADRSSLFSVRPIMEELINLVAQRTGLAPDKARSRLRKVMIPHR